MVTHVNSYTISFRLGSNIAKKVMEHEESNSIIVH